MPPEPGQILPPDRLTTGRHGRAGMMIDIYTAGIAGRGPPLSGLTNVSAYLRTTDEDARPSAPTESGHAEKGDDVNRRGTGAVGVVVGLMVALLPVTPARAATQAAPPVALASPAQQCGDLKKEAAKVALTRGSGTATCVSKTSRKVVRTDSATLAGDICGGTTARKRKGTCLVEDGILTIFAVPSGAIVGAITYTVSGITTVAHNSLGWTQSFNYQASVVAGSGPPVSATMIYAEPLCITNCTVTGSGLIGGSAMPGNSQSATAYYATSDQGGKWDAQSGFKFWFANEFWVYGVSNTLTHTPGTHRCDHVLDGYPAGCAYAGVRPTLEIPTARYPMYAWHIRMALAYGLDGILTRTQDANLKSRNYDTACPTGPNYPRPANYSCDEYPFQSTYEGAASQPYGRQFFYIDWSTGKGYNCQAPWLPARTTAERDGWSTCMIPIGENTLGGSDLGVFYYENRVVDRDTFEVRVI